MRKTKIVCTIGPACDSEEILRAMMLAGMNVARLNFSHGTHAEHQVRIDRIKKLRTELGLPIAIMLDTKGPEYRIGTFEGGKITLDIGDTFTFTTEPVTGSSERVSVSYPGLARDLEAGDTVQRRAHRPDRHRHDRYRCYLPRHRRRRAVRPQEHELPEQGAQAGLPERAGQARPALRH